ncbi:sodium-translocating pyrophosphatase [Solirubrobacter sp. CPCC 204708]|uniref:K(+)-insensitive pyrophosphate-energized proton pump n=1 Tax=Solirubrobacter deserti TaxID=2282478 RepID=A0ABT4RVX6_9ACTN|nr:sodium-translocating pyrophosphatase [Solirubrobacter deserti]MBE2316409.1 sodium-translocating pyrophosphatase [Solirubrobacter deserti]MDA0142513.1 sodium-translocating pyrophosphatase [Solirubrobacter deserti]
MSDFLSDYGALIAVVCALLAVVYGVLTTRSLLALSPGNEVMQRLSAAVQEGAQAYLRRQYTTIAIVGVILFIALIPLQDIYVAVGFAIGGLASAAAGFIGMNVSVRSNARVAEAARGGISPALAVAFRGGAVTGMLVVGLALLGTAGYYLILTELFDRDPKEAVYALVGLGFGGSLISVFARLGGGIFTKGADVGADIVGKIEAGIPEDDPRNPAVIADNVGDNVGDCAGMAADLFETYAVTAVAVMLLGVLTFQGEAVVLFPLVMGGVSIIASIIGAFFVRTSSGNVERALYQGTIVAGIISALLFIPVTSWMMDGLVPTEDGGALPSWTDIYFCALIGLAVTGALFVITDYYTSTRFAPVRSTAKASETGHATNIIQGLAQGLQATAAPAIVIVLAIWGAAEFAGVYGVAVAVMAQLSLCGLIVALDAFGPITDNAGGIAEMANMPEEVRNVTDPLDAVGNTTKAVTKGYAIGSAALAALVLFAAFKIELEEKGGVVVEFLLDDPFVLMGLLIGGMMVCLFAALSMEAVGRAGSAVVEEVRRQFREKPGIMDGTEQPEYGQCVDIVTRAAQREMIIPSLIPIVVTVIVGILSVEMLGGLLIGVIVVGLFFAVMMTSGGGAWDNAKKLIEDGEHGGKGSIAHQASVTGDTVGDPFKDTAGPAINPMIKVANIVALLIIPLIT